MNKKMMKRSLALGALMAFVITGSVAFAGAGDIAAEGKDSIYTSEQAGDGSLKIIGGWDYYKDNSAGSNFDHSSVSTNITVNSGKFDEVIGGNHIKQPGNAAYDVKIADTNILIKDGEFGYVIGGSKANNSDNTVLTTGNIKLTISSGTFKDGVIGGNYIKSTGNAGAGTPAKTTAHAGNITTEISGGIFSGTVYGGSVADNYGTTQTEGKPALEVNDKSSSLTITGGTFANGIFGAGMAKGESSILNVELAKLAIKGDVTISGGRIIGGANAVSGGKANVKNTEVTIEGLKAGDYARALYAGGNDSVISDSTKLTIKDSVLGNGNNKWGIYGGSRITLANVQLNEAKNIEVTVEDSHLAADVRGGAGLFASNSTISSGESIVTVKNTSVDGFSDQNQNNWSGRIFGAGIIEDVSNSIMNQGATNVYIENVGGTTYDKDKGEAVVNRDPGAEVYGGGQAYATKNSVLNIGKTNLIIGGSDTALAYVFGGSSISGTVNKNDSSVVVVGETNVIVNDGLIKNVLVGGNDNNWFGTSVVGVLNDATGEHEFNGHKYDNGKTKATLNGGGSDELMVVGGTYASYSSYYDKNGKREAMVFGSTEVNINGGLALDVVGGGYSEYSSNKVIDESKVTDDAPISAVLGTTNVNINGGNIKNNVIGGGFAYSNKAALASKANVEGNTNITITKGEIGGAVIAGGLAMGENTQANVTGTATVTMSGGSVVGDVILGGFADGNGASATVEKAVLNYAGGNIGGDIVANAKVADVNFNADGFANKIVTDGSEMNIYGDVAFVNSNEMIVASTGSINLAGGNMSGVLNIAKDSKVNLTGATFTANDLATGIVGGGKLVLTDSGVLSTTANQIFTKADTVGSDFAGNAITDIANEKVDFVSGTVSLTDKEYNFDFVQSAVDTMQKHNSSKTNVVMTGTLVGGVEDNRVTVDEAAGLGNDVALDKVTAEADGNLLVGSTKADEETVEGIEIKDSVANGFNVGSLELAAGSTGMVITNAQEVTLGGSEGGSVITVEKDAEAKVNVVVGTNDVVDGASKTTGTLNIGNALANADTEYTLNGSVTVNADSTLNTKGNTTITDDIELNGGSVNAVNGKLEANTIVVNEGTNTITGNVSGIFSAQQDTVTNIGTADASATTSFESVNLNGSTICFDPAWDKAAGQHGMVFDKNIDGNVQIARNNYVAIGTSDTTAAKTMFEKTGLKFGEKDVTAVLYIAGNQTLGTNGSIYVDGGKSASGDFGATTAGSFNAAANSVTMVDGSKIKDNAALSGVTSATIDQDSAKLYIDGAKKGETYHVIAGVDDGWADKNIISDNSLLEFKGDTTTDSKYDVTASLKKVNDVYGNKVIIANVVDNTLDKHDTSDAAGFFNAAVSSKNNASLEAQISALNSAGAMSELAGVAHSTYAVSNILTDAVADHVSLSNELDHDSDIWAHYVHNKENVKGLSVANFGADYDAQYNGIVVGGDFYKKDNVVAGAALTYVDGNINGSTLAARTENDAEYYGVSVYGSVTNDDNAVIGDISYLHGKNEITQHNSGFALTGEPESDAFSVGVRVEKSIETQAGKFVPYAGVRYMHVGTGNYTNFIGMNYDADDANLFLLPVGLKYSAEAKVGGMTIRPVAEVGYVWAMGDTDSAQTVSLNGAADGFGYDVTDEGSYFARIGVEAVSDNVTYGLGYEYQKGDSVKANKWMANLNFSF